MPSPHAPFCKRFHKVMPSHGRRRVLGILGASAASVSVASLARAQPAAAPLDIAAYPALDQILRDTRPRWQSIAPGFDIRLVAREFGDHHSALTAAMAARKGLPDLMAVEFGFLARFAASGALADLSTLPGVAELSTGVVPYAIAQCRLAGGLYALPVDIGPGVSFIRADLLERARITEQQVLSSWEGFVEAAGCFVRLTAPTCCRMQEI